MLVSFRGLLTVALAIFAGGSAEGSQQEVSAVTVTEHATVLLGRILRASGEPAGEVDFSVRVHSKWTERLRQRTAADGSFRIALQHYFPGTPAKSILITELGEERKDVQRDYVCLEGPIRLAPGDVDLGTLKLKPQAVGAAGRVVDVEGEGVAGARVWISKLGLRDPDAPDHATRYLHSWLRTTSKADGSFVVYVQDPGSLLDSDTLVATASLDKLTTLQHVPVKSGTTDIHLELREGTRVRVDTRLVGPGWVEDQSFQFRNLDVGYGSRIFRRGKEDTIHSLRPGRYLLLARLIDGVEGSFVVIGKEFVLKPGEAYADPLHNPVRIEHYVRRHEFEVFLPDGTRPKWIEFGTQHGQHWRTRHLNRKGDRFKITTSFEQDTFACWFEAKGSRRLYLDALPKDGIVRLSEGIGVKIRLVGAPTLDDATAHRHQPFLRADDGDPFSPYMQSFRFNAEGEAELLLPFAGEFQLFIPTPGMSPVEATRGFQPWSETKLRIPETGGIVEVARVSGR